MNELWRTCRLNFDPFEAFFADSRRVAENGTLVLQQDDMLACYAYIYQQSVHAKR